MGKSLEEVHQSIDLSRERKPLKRLWLYLGPAFLVSVGYMDPGNWATDLAGGSRYGYSLVWVLLMSNLIALLMQSHAARLGIVRGLDLAQSTRSMYPGWLHIPQYILAELAIAATDLAEVLGMAIGLKLLFGLPLIWGVGLAVLDTFLVLYLQHKGMRYMEAFILALIATIGGAFLVEMIFAGPSVSGIAGGLIPGLPDSGALYIAIGIIGATVMPHNLYLHSALVQTRRNREGREGIASAIRYNFIDSALALNLALFVNAAILILAASVFHQAGHTEIAAIEDAYHLLEPLLGERLAPILFAVALIAAGQSSTITGTLAGQIVMEGFLDLRIAPWLRRLITRGLAVVPALLVIGIMGEEMVNELLIFSQVALSLQLGFALVPLIHSVSNRTQMQEFTIQWHWKLLSWVAASVIVLLNLWLVWQTLHDWHQQKTVSDTVLYLVLYPVFLFAVGLLLFIIIYPILKRRDVQGEVHEEISWSGVAAKPFRRIGVCLDFSASDERAIAHALGLKSENAAFFLIHVVESPLARRTGRLVSDKESIEDERRLRQAASYFRKFSIDTKEVLTFGDPKSAIPEMTKVHQLDLLILAGHGHQGLGDMVYGQTANTVRHRAGIPVLIV